LAHTNRGGHCAGNAGKIPGNAIRLLASGL
jgi:hypothetical protein